jgi:hypothetical protein
MAKPRSSAKPGFSAALVEPSARADAPTCLSVRLVSSLARRMSMVLMKDLSSSLKSVALSETASATEKSSIGYIRVKTSSGFWRSTTR